MTINLFDEEHRKLIGKFIDANMGRLEYNGDIFKILEGNLKELLETRMKEDLGGNSFKQAKTRMAPINVFKKIVDKQTSIYKQAVIRTVENGNDADEKLLRWYEEKLNINRRLGKNNALYNAYCYSLLQITLTDINDRGVGTPMIRSNPNHQFLVMSTSPTDPTSADVIILCMPKITNDAGKEDECYYVTTSHQFIIMNRHGEIHTREMMRFESDGINPYGTTPFIYANASEHLVMPMIQEDNKEMGILIPLLLTDLNYAVKFQAFSTFVATNSDDTKIELAPDSVIFLKDDGSGNPAKFEVVKPTVDISETLSLASSEMSLWLTSKGIRPGAVGQLGPDQFRSGVSKMIDESDTYESVKEQIAIYQQFEHQLWEKLLKVIHPFWVTAGRVENTTRFSPSATVRTKFSDPKPLQTRGELIKELETEVKAGFTTVENAVRKLNPDLDDKAIKALVAEAKGELAARRPTPFPRGGDDDASRLVS